MPDFPRLSTLKTGLRCRCPRCGKGPLLTGFLKIRDACPACGLDYGFADPADGPAFFVMSGVGILVMAAFAVVEVLYRPPILFHFLVTLPLFVVVCLATLRPTKGWLVSEQYVHKAEEARFEHTGRHGPF
jgi:uncharacterized protein (DUF983 family)